MGKIERGLNDPRFSHLKSDPTFNALKRKDRKVTLEKRFEAALTDSRFSRAAAVDKRGRVLKAKTDASLHHLYDIDQTKKDITKKKPEKKVESEEEDDDDEEKESDEQEEEESGSEDEEEGSAQIKLDLARGGGGIVSSSEDESGSEWELEDAGEEHEWGELDREARRVEWASRRLAICNLDWDSLCCEDLFMMLSSFKPSGGSVEKLTIYLSDLGKERLAMEEKHGPKIDLEVEDNEEDEETVDEETLRRNPKRREAIRKYQLERLKYYYAVLECDSEHTASVLYESCDGVEYESSGFRLDLRFIPDAMSFDESRVKDRVLAEEVQADKYKPRDVSNTALSFSNVKLSWEDDDPNRMKKMKEAFEDDADLEGAEGELIAGSDDEEEVEQGFKPISKKDRLALLLHGTEENDEEVEVEWEEDEEEKKASNPIKEKKNKDSGKKSTWEQFLEKRKEKRRQRKTAVAELKRKAKEEREADTGTTARKTQKNESAVISKERPAVIDDDRFKALFTDSAFAIDQSTGLAKSKTMLEKQNEGRRKRRADDMGKGSTEESYLIAKLKNKTSKWKQ